jgi:hypothetical protein
MRPIFNQYLFWDNDDTIFAWRLAKKGNQVRYDYNRKEYYVYVVDGEMLKRITAPTFRYTLTQHDPELTNREKLQKEKRRDLTKTPVLIKSVKGNK